MATETLRVETLSRAHDRAAFGCGVESLDSYLQRQASQDVRRKANAVFVLVAKERPRAVLGYYTLCAFGLAPGSVPVEAQRHLPRYPIVSATLIGRLAVATARHGEGLGAFLLGHAIRKAFESASIVGSSMLVVDSIDDRAHRFYLAHGFLPLPESNRLVLPMATIAKLF